MHLLHLRQHPQNMSISNGEATFNASNPLMPVWKQMDRICTQHANIDELCCLFFPHPHNPKPITQLTMVFWSIICILSVAISQETNSLVIWVPKLLFVRVILPGHSNSLLTDTFLDLFTNQYPFSTFSLIQTHFNVGIIEMSITTYKREFCTTCIYHKWPQIQLFLPWAPNY